MIINTSCDTTIFKIYRLTINGSISESVCAGGIICSAIVDTRISVIVGPTDDINLILKTLGVSPTQVRNDMFYVTTALSLLVIFVYSTL